MYRTLPETGGRERATLLVYKGDGLARTEDDVENLKDPAAWNKGELTTETELSAQHVCFTSYASGLGADMFRILGLNRTVYKVNNHGLWYSLRPMILSLHNTYTDSRLCIKQQHTSHRRTRWRAFSNIP